MCGMFILKHFCNLSNESLVELNSKFCRTKTSNSKVATILVMTDTKTTFFSQILLAIDLTVMLF